MNKKIMLFGFVIFASFLIFGCINIPEPHENRSILNAFNENKEFEFIPAERLENIEKIIQLSDTYYYGSSFIMRDTMQVDMAMPTGAIAEESMVKSPNDFSTTNVQVFGIDELDIVKIDSLTGNKIYYLNGDKLNLINSYPIENMEVYKSINTEYGNGIYEYKNSIMTISYNKIETFDKNGNSKWYANLNATYLDSRMKDGIVYLILQESPTYPYTPKPIRICGELGCNQIEIDYADIYIPRNMDGNVFYDILSIDIENGEVLDKKTFMGPYSSTTYVSEENIYFAMYKNNPESQVMFYYLLDEGKNLINNEVYNRLIYLNALNISDQAKTVEFEIIMQSIYQGLTNEERAELSNDLQKGYSSYVLKYPEKKEYTGILKVSYLNGELEMAETGKIPGRLLNQFSMDEYENNLRIAFTFGNRDDSQNGLIILDKEMNELSRITGMAEGERIYAIRFIGETGYMVTYRQIDPLFIIDLSNPSKPEVKGELKVPGYSTYLHPIGDNKLIGIGQDDWKMKISLFDVSNPSKPLELDSFITEEGWSEALYNHHAFLWDPNNNFAIIPMGNKNYVFEIKNSEEIGMRKIIEENAVRNLYVDNILYVISYNKISAYSMDDFSEIKYINIEGSNYPVGYY
ncbi:MAG: beta-propeller domain-containing protein [Candidatus Micrarchaeia archaeon]|jgi:inhibitor of cysteine peptidase